MANPLVGPDSRTFSRGEKGGIDSFSPRGGQKGSRQDSAGAAEGKKENKYPQDSDLDRGQA
jgi:hypothetical protein